MAPPNEICKHSNQSLVKSLDWRSKTESAKSLILIWGSGMERFGAYKTVSFEIRTLLSKTIR